MVLISPYAIYESNITLDYLSKHNIATVAKQHIFPSNQ